MAQPKEAGEIANIAQRVAGARAKEVFVQYFERHHAVPPSSPLLDELVNDRVAGLDARALKAIPAVAFYELPCRRLFLLGPKVKPTANLPPKACLPATNSVLCIYDSSILGGHEPQVESRKLTGNAFEDHDYPAPWVFW
eukprot:1033129-Alexandrium_andersonii.AAC.2